MPQMLKKKALHISFKFIRDDEVVGQWIPAMGLILFAVYGSALLGIETKQKSSRARGGFIHGG